MTGPGIGCAPWANRRHSDDDKADKGSCSPGLPAGHHAWRAIPHRPEPIFTDRHGTRMARTEANAPWRLKAGKPIAANSLIARHFSDGTDQPCLRAESPVPPARSAPLVRVSP